MRKTFINTLTNIARKDKNIWLLTADMGFSVLENFFQEFSDRTINTGIAEQNAMAIAAGLALAGKKVYVYSIAPFVTLRCLEQIKNDVCYMNTDVKIIGIGGGLCYGSAGATHHSIEDIGVMRVLPNIKVYAPMDTLELKGIIEQTYLTKSPTYIRIGNKTCENFTEIPFNIDKARVLFSGEDSAIIFTGDIADQALIFAEQLRNKNKKPYLISMPSLKPIDEELIKYLVGKNIEIYSLEEHNIYGGLASALSEIIAQTGKVVKFTPFAVPDKFSHYVGDRNFLRKKMNIGFN